MSYESSERGIQIPFSQRSMLQNPISINKISFRKQLPFSVAFKKLPFAVMKDMKIPIPSTENEQIPVPIFTYYREITIKLSMRKE